MAARPVMLPSETGRKAMDGKSKGDRDPAAHQPTKAAIKEDVSIDATPEALAWSLTRGGAKRREHAKSHPSLPSQKA